MQTTQIEFSGKDISAAIENACKSLCAQRENLDIEIISAGSSGIFGLGRRQARILVTQKTVSKSPPEESASFSLEEVQENVSQCKVNQATLAKIRTDCTSRPSEKKKTPSRTKEHKEETDEEDDLNPEILAEAKEKLTRILELMDFSLELAISQQDRKIIAHLTGEQAGELVGDDGQVLDSLQFLMRKIMSKQFQKKIMVAIDVGDYRANRKTELERLALDTAAEVKNTGKTRTLAPLNPAERRVIHVTLQDDETVRSKSVGDGLFKKILVYPIGSNRKVPSDRRRFSRNPRPSHRKN